MPPIDRYGTTRPDRTPVYVGVGLLVLALLGWMIWAVSNRDGEDYAVTSTTVTRSQPVTEREVALEAQRRTVTETRSGSTMPAAAPTITVEPTIQIVEEPPTTGPNGAVSEDPVASVPDDRDAGEVSLDAPAAEPPAATPTAEAEAELAAFVADARENLTAMRREMTEFRTHPEVTLDTAEQEQLRGLEQRLHELEQRVNSLQSAGAAQLAPLEEEIRTAVEDLEEDFDEMLSAAGIEDPG